MRIDDAATQLSVSTASIRNWIKTGYLVQTGKNRISHASFEGFKCNVAGSEKLISRANKSLKDAHDHASLKKDIELLLSNKLLGNHELGQKYESSLSNAYRNREGIYYTPHDIVEKFFQYLPDDKGRLTFCDPCCGSGNFVMAAIAAGFSPENVFAYDIDPVAVAITKKRLEDETGITDCNIICLDFLDATINSKVDSYDVIFTNPPWGKKLDRPLKQKYARFFGAGKSQDTTSLFFFAALSQLNMHGHIGFLVQDAFFNVASYEDVRERTLGMTVKALLDFGKPFKGLLTRAKGIIINNAQAADGNSVECINSGSRHRRLQHSFSQNPRSILNLNCTQQEADAITHLYGLPHVTLSGRASWGLGIVTGNNKKFIIDRAVDGYLAVHKGADIKAEGISAAQAFIPNDLSLYQQVAPQELYEAREKLIYKFISSELVFFLDTEQRYVLNSANILIPNNDFPISTQQLCQLLNSKLINWLFRTIFDTHKILRSDLEALPVHIDYFNANPSFDESTFHQYLGLEALESGAFRLIK